MNRLQARLYAMKRQADYLEARQLTKDKGGLPSNILHDDYLVKSDNWKRIREVYPAWALEFLVYPEKGGQFQKGTDVVDSKEDGKGRKWVLPASFVPEKAIGKEKIGLFIEPEEVTEESNKVVLFPKPKSIVVLHNFIQQNQGFGKVDEETRIPLEVDPELWEEIPVEEKRWLYRIEGVGVRPFIRGFVGCHDGHGIVNWSKPDSDFGVTYTVLENDYPSLQVKDAPAHKGILLKGIAFEEFMSLLEAADSNLQELSKTLGTEKLEGILKFMQRLRSDSETALPKLLIKDAPAHDGILLKGITLSEYSRLIEAAYSNLQELTELVDTKKLEGILKFMQRLNSE